MSIARFHEPFFSFSEVDNLINEALRAPGSWQNTALEKLSENRVLKPRMDLHEDPAAGTVTASFELPGLTKDQVKIDVHNNHVTVSGEISEGEERNQDGFVIKERRLGKFSRSIALQEDTQPDAIKASMENGILTINFPKNAPGQEPRRIAID